MLIEHVWNLRLGEQQVRFSDLHPRAARYRAERLRDVLAQLHMVRGSLTQIGRTSQSLEELTHQLDTEWRELMHRAGDRIDPRHQAKLPLGVGERREDHILFLDECGSHVIGTRDTKFPVFCLCGVVIPAGRYSEIDQEWRAWKSAMLGGEEAIVHEPDVRHRVSRFRGASKEEGDAIEASMNELLEKMDFRCIAAVVDLRALEAEHPDSRVDEFLPKSSYLMSIDFVLERFIHYLQNVGNGAHGTVTAESRGTREDAQVHAEFIRLHLEGTQFVSDKAFRGHLRPYIEFIRKSRNESGLQIADLAARPFAEKVLGLTETPTRWDIFQAKLYDGLKYEPHKYGLKVFPLTDDNDPFPHLPRKAKGDALAPPLAD